MSEATLDSIGAPTESNAPKQTSQPTQQKRGPLGKLFRALLWLILIVVLLIVLVVVLAYSFTATDKGFNLALSQASSRVEGLDIVDPSGNLSNGIKASGVTYKNDTMDVEMSGLDSAWQSSCLLDKKFCVERLIIEKMRVEMLVEAQTSTDAPRTDSIELPSFPIPLDVNLDDVQVKEFIFQPAGDAPEQVIKDVRLQASNVGNTLTINQLTAAYQNFSADITGDITLEDDYPLDLNIVANGTDVIEENDFQLKLHASNSVEDLVFDATVSGAADVALSGTAKPLDPKLPLSLTINADQVGWPLDTLQIAKAEQLAISVEGDLDDFNATFETQLSGENIPDASVKLTAVANPTRVLVPDITVNTLGGSITGEAATTLGDTLSWTSDIVLKNINPAGVAPNIDGDLSGEFIAKGGVQDGKWMLDLTKGDINGTLQGFPYDLDVVVSKSYDETWDVKKLILNNGENQVNASGTATSTVLDFNADINLTQLQNLLPGLAGGYKANLKLSGKPTEPNVVLQAESQVLKYNDLLIVGLNMDADVARGGKEASTLSLTVNQIQQGTQLVQNSKINLDGTLADHSIKFFADGPQATAIDFTAEGGLNENFDWLGQMQSVELELPAHKITLAEPFELGWDNKIKKARIGAHCWRTEETRLCLENDVLAEPTGTADVSLIAYPMARLNPFLPSDSELQGVVNANTNIKWGEQYPGGFDITLKSQINKGGIKVEDASFDALSFAYELFDINANATGEQIKAELALKSDALGNANVDFIMDPSQESKPISGDISLEGLNISFLQAFLPDFDAISGIVNANGKLSGSLTDPGFNGSVVLDNPIAQAETLPLSVDGGKITVNVNGTRAEISGRLESGDGQVGIAGNADWSNITAWKADFILKGNDLNVQSPPLEESSVNTDVRIALKPGSVRIAGDVDVPEAAIEIAEIPAGASTLSDDIIIIEDEEAAAEERAEAAEQAPVAGSTDIDVQLNVSLGNDVNLEAYGLVASLTGDMTVAINPPRPVQLGGEIRIVEGIFKQYGQNLKVEDGQVLFVGPIDQTQLAMDAVRTIDGEDRVAGLRVGGRVAEPSIELFTDPADKPQDSILSYVLLGRDINDTSDAEQNLLASAALALTLKGGQGTANKLASKLGIQDFSLGSQGRGEDTQVVVSGRLNDRLLLRYGQNVFASNGGTLFLRYDLTKKLYLEASEGAERAVDLFYSFSF